MRSLHTVQARRRTALTPAAPAMLNHARPTHNQNRAVKPLCGKSHASSVRGPAASSRSHGTSGASHMKLIGTAFSARTGVRGEPAAVIRRQGDHQGRGFGGGVEGSVKKPRLVPLPSLRRGSTTRAILQPNATVSLLLTVISPPGQYTTVHRMLDVAHAPYRLGFTHY